MALVPEIIRRENPYKKRKESDATTALCEKNKSQSRSSGFQN